MDDEDFTPPRRVPHSAGFERALIREWQRTNRRLYWVALAFGTWGVLTLICVTAVLAAIIVGAVEGGESGPERIRDFAEGRSGLSEMNQSAATVETSWGWCGREPLDGGGNLTLEVRDMSCDDARTLIGDQGCADCADAAFQCAEKDTGNKQFMWVCTSRETDASFRYSAGT